MPYIGTQPVSGLFLELDALTASATDQYTLKLNTADYFPETTNNLLVSINGIIQGSSTMSLNGAVLTVGATLSSSDTIDFVRVFGNVGTVSTPTDGSVTANKIGTGAVTSAKIADDAVVLTSKVSGILPVVNGGTGATSFVNTYTQLGTTTATTSGESVTITGIPTTAKQIIIHFMGVSHNGSGGNRTYTMLLGTASGIATSGYFSTVSATGTGNAQGTSTGQFAIYYEASGSDTLYGNVTLNLANSATHTYTQTGAIRSGGYVGLSGGMCNLGGALTQVKILVSGRAFDAGSISVTYI